MMPPAKRNTFLFVQLANALGRIVTERHFPGMQVALAAIDALCWDCYLLIEIAGPDFLY